MSVVVELMQATRGVQVPTYWGVRLQGNESAPANGVSALAS